MIDRGELIKDMERCMGNKECFRCAKAFKDGNAVCNDFKKGAVLIPVSFVKNAIELLKEHEALPIVYQINEYTGLPMALCPSCGEALIQFHSGVDGKESKFCYYCGQEVQW